MSAVGVEFIRAGAHGLNMGLASTLNGGNFWQGFASGALSSGMGSFAQNVKMPSGLMFASTTAMGGVSAWATGGSFLEGAYQGMCVGVYNHNYHILLPEVECVANNKNQVIWPTITRIVYYAFMVDSHHSRGTYYMYSNENCVYQSSAVSGAPSKYTIPEGRYNVNDIWNRSTKSGFCRKGVAYTASIEENDFFDCYAGRNRTDIRIHPCRDQYTEGCIGLTWDDAEGLKTNRDMIQQTLNRNPGKTIPLDVYIFNRK